MPLSLLRLWTGPLPHQELFPDRKINPLLHWLIHPVKRRLAKYYLLILQKVFGLKVIAVTGSAGKTTLKNMLTSILKIEGPTVATRDNITPTYNIPSTIFRCPPGTRYLILEMGIEYPGDMDFYTWLAQPDLGLILNVNRTHTQYLESISEVSAEKSKLLSILPPTGFAIVNADDPNIKIETSAPVSKFGTSTDCYVQIKSSSLTPDFTTQVEFLINHKSYVINLPLLGRHFSIKAAAAASAATLLDVRLQNIIYGLEHTPSPPHRMQVIRLPQGPILIDDSYNANPLAVLASLDTLAELARITGLIPVLIFGQMNELGQYEKSAHEEIGLKIKNLKFKILFCTGPATKHTIASAGFGQYFESVDELTKAVSLALSTSHLALIKASRSFHFETVVDYLYSLHR